MEKSHQFYHQLIQKLTNKYPQLSFELNSLQNQIDQTISNNQPFYYLHQLITITDQIKILLKQSLQDIPTLYHIYQRYVQLIEPLQHTFYNQHHHQYTSLHHNSTQMKINLIELLKQERQKSKTDFDNLFSGMSQTLLLKQTKIQQLEQQLKQHHNKYVTFQNLPSEEFKQENKHLKTQLYRLTQKIHMLQKQKQQNQHKSINHKNHTPRKSQNYQLQNHKVNEKTIQKIINSANTQPQIIFNDLVTNEISGWQQPSQRNMLNPYNTFLSPFSDDYKNRSSCSHQKNTSDFQQNNPNQFWRFLLVQSSSIQNFLAQ